MIDPESRRWFIEKIAQTPEYLDKVYLSEIEKLLIKAESALRDANRHGTIEQIKYQIGWLDGVQRCCSVIDGLKLSERKPEFGPGLLARIFQGEPNHP